MFAETPLRTAGVTPDIPGIGDHHSRELYHTDEIGSDAYEKTK